MTGRHRNNRLAQGQDDRLEDMVVGIETGMEAACIDAGMHRGRMQAKQNT